MPRCKTHPSMSLLSGKSYCTLDEDWTVDTFVTESDKRKFEYEMMSGGKARTRLAYQRYLKRNGLTDDVSLKELRKSDLGARKQEQHLNESVSKITDKLFKGFRYGNQPCKTEKQYKLRKRLESVLKS